MLREEAWRYTSSRWLPFAHGSKTGSRCRFEKPFSKHASVNGILLMFQRINIASP